MAINNKPEKNLQVGVLGNWGYYEVHLDLGMGFVLISDALNIKPGFGKTAIFL